MAMAGPEGLTPSAFLEIIGAWEVLGGPQHFRYFVVREDLQFGWIPELGEVDRASRASLTALIEARPLDKWRPANWLGFTFSEGEITVSDGAGRDMAYYRFRTATAPTTVETLTGPVELAHGEILWAQTYRFPSLGEAVELASELAPQPLREHKLRRLPER